MPSPRVSMDYDGGVDEIWPQSDSGSLATTTSSATSIAPETDKKRSLESQPEDTLGPSTGRSEGGEKTLNVVPDEGPLEKLKLMLVADDERRSPAGVVAVSPASCRSTTTSEKVFSFSSPDLSRARLEQARSPVQRMLRLARAPGGSMRFFIDLEEGPAVTAGTAV